MVVWHNTPDAARIPEVVQAGQPVSLWIGSFPIEPEQSVWAELNVKKPDGTVATKKHPAEWHSNDEGRHNSYWITRIGTFDAGDRVDYIIRGSVRDQEVADKDSYGFEVS